MRTRTKGILTILVILVIAMGAVAVWQWNNLMALHDGLAMDPIAIQEELEEQQEQFDAVMDEYQVPHKEFTQEEIDQLVSGALSASEMADSMLQGEKPSNAQGQQEESTEGSPGMESKLACEAALYAGFNTLVCCKDCCWCGCNRCVDLYHQRRCLRGSVGGISSE